MRWQQTLCPTYEIVIVAISYGRVTKSPVWDTMMSKKKYGVALLRRRNKGTTPSWNCQVTHLLLSGGLRSLSKLRLMLYFKSLKLFMKYSSGLISSWKQTEQLEWKTQVVPNMIKGYQFKLWSFSLHNFCNKTFLPRGQFLIVLNIIKWIWIMRAWVTRFFKSLWEVHVITYTYPRYPKGPFEIW